MSDRTRAKRLPAELIDIAYTRQASDASDDSASVKAALFRMTVRDILDNGLTKKQKCYIMYYYRDGLTMEEIAKRCGVNRSTVSRTVAAARRKIEQRLIYLARPR